MDKINEHTNVSKGEADAKVLYRHYNLFGTNYQTCSKPDMLKLMQDNELAYVYYCVLSPLNGKKDIQIHQMMDKLRKKYKFRHMLLFSEKAKRLHYNLILVLNDSEFETYNHGKILFNTYFVHAKYISDYPNMNRLLTYCTKDEGDIDYDYRIVSDPRH